MTLSTPATTFISQASQETMRETGLGIYVTQTSSSLFTQASGSKLRQTGGHDIKINALRCFWL